ncbi:hypothetical protein [Mediterraneibacter gnavus]|uniref:hypothetical protein n=1 Tax=Mediterraneibacter gnavus TaxID=33038 RepID=UPI0006C30CDD|nr:hypothetical protein [Mediterraneibacter gnavus]CUO41611.1 Uncharacterised protein [Mediterraneibacter gnavus]
MFEMVDGTGIIGVDMICPLGVSAPQPPNYDRVELEGAGMLVLPNSLDAPLEGLELGGKTEQVQTTGANLFDEKLLLDFDSENYDKTQSGSGFYYYKFPVNGTVTASTKNANKNGEYLTVGIKPDGSDKTWLSHGSAAISKYKTLTPEDGNIYLGVNNSLERVKSMIQNTGGIIINEGSAAKPYEPYTGGKPSPSPEYPQEIKNSGKWNEEKQKYEIEVVLSGKNLLDITACEDGKIFEGSGNIISADNGLLTDFIPCFPNSQYSRSRTGFTVVAFYDCDKNKIGFEIVGNATFVTPEKCRYFRYSINKVQVDYKKLVACPGDTVMDYEPYYHKPIFLNLTSDRPITKWDKLVEQGGEIGWLYAGVVIDRFDGQSNKISIANKQGDVRNFSIRFENVANGNGNSDIFVDKYRAVQLSYTKAEYGICCNWNDGVKYFSAPNENVATVDEFKAWLVENPLKIAYETTNPEFIPLPQSEQNAIRALKTYYPTTVITVDGGELDPDIKVTYRKEK